MQVSIDNSLGLVVTSYENGKVRINGTDYVHSIILTDQNVLPNWRPQCFAETTAADFKLILELQPEIILWGVGAEMVLAPHEVLAKVYAKHIGIEVMTTAAACRTYNLLMADGRKVVAGLII